MTAQIRFFIEGQQMPPEGTAVMNPLIETITNNELLTSLGKHALLNPTDIEVAVGANEDTLDAEFVITSWHETNGSPAGKLQVHRTLFDMLATKRNQYAIGESGELYGLNDAQRICCNALMMTVGIGYELRQYLNTRNRQFPPRPFGIN